MIALEKDAAAQQSYLAGEYTISSGDVNGREYWISKDGAHAIWYETVNQVWMVGLIDNLGEDMSGVLSCCCSRALLLHA